MKTLGEGLAGWLALVMECGNRKALGSKTTENVRGTNLTVKENKQVLPRREKLTLRR